ncbi:MAG: Hsp20/alpha crystallin family protein [Clostridium sp.]|jgi:HSP20 family protein
MLMPSIFTNRLFDDWMNISFPDLNQRLYGSSSQPSMKTDVKETENGFEVSMDLPGFKKDEISAELKNGYLTIRAERQVNHDTPDGGKPGTYIRQERYSGSLQRSFYIGEGITEQEIHGKFENGTLSLTIPKKPEKEKVPEKHFVAIEG